MAETTNPAARAESGVTAPAGRRTEHRGFALALLVSLAPAVMVALAPTAAVAQSTKKAPAKGEAEAPPAEDETGDDWTSKQREGSAGGLRDPELGEAPTTIEEDPERRPSPLTPRPEEMPGRPSGAAPDYEGLLAELVALRARVHALTAALYDSKLRISLEADGDDVPIAALTVTVDGGVVYVAPERFIGADERVVYEHAVAPGRHVIGVEVERFDPRAKGYRAWQATRYAVEVPEKRTLSASIEIEDDSSMDDPTSGRYRSNAKMRVEVIEP